MKTLTKLFASDTAQMFWGGYLLFFGFGLFGSLIEGHLWSFFVGTLIVYAILFPIGFAVLKHYLRLT